MKGSVTAVCTTVIKTCGYAVVVLYYVDLNYLKLHLRNVFFFCYVSEMKLLRRVQIQRLDM